MRHCDSAFAERGGDRLIFSELLQKIDRFADFIVADGDQPMGYAALYANNMETRVGYISLIAVLPEYQKKRIGSKLMETCEEIAKENGMETIRLEVYLNNYKAISFYEQHGFQKQHETDHGSMYMIKPL